MNELRHLQFELAGICNASCSYCTWQKRSTGKQFMDRDLAFRLLDEAKAMGAESLRHHGLGESMLHPNLLEILQRGEDLGLPHSVSTNCFNLHGEVADGLRKLRNLELILAIPWVMKHSFVTRCVNNALDYMAGPSENHSLHVQMVCDEGARQHYRRFVDTFLPYVERNPRALLHLKQPYTWPNAAPSRGFIDLELQGRPQVVLGTEATPVSLATGCGMPTNFLMVLADGTCVPCCVGMDDWGLGNVKDSTLLDVWNSPRMTQIREFWRSADDSIPCGHCKKRTDCRTE